MICHYVSCQQQTSNLNSNNYYSYNSSNFGFLNTNFFTVTFWAMIVNQNDQFILQINQNGNMIYSVNSLAGTLIVQYYRLQLLYSTSIVIPYPNMWVLYSFRLQRLQNRLFMLFTPTNNYIQSSYSLPLGILTNFQNLSIYCFQHCINLYKNLDNSVTFTDQVANLKFSDQNFSPSLNVFGDDLPDLQLAYLTFEEKIYTQYLLDWTGNYYPIAGTSYSIDINDPIINTTGIYIYDQQVITINNLILPNIVDISMNLEIFNITQITYIFSLTDSLQQQTIKAYVQSNTVYINIQTTSQNVSLPMFYCFQSNNILNFYVNLFQNRFSTVLFLDMACYNQNYQIDRNYMQLNPIDFNKSWNLMIGSINNSAGYQFRPKLFSINQGNKMANPYLQNNCYYQISGQCQTCYYNYIRQSDGQCLSACNSTSYLQVLDITANLCRRLCHPTCSTCMEPDVCLSCDGIRINPPYCKCPSGYFDDKINPNCQKYYRLPDVQSGKVEYQCISGNYSVVTNFIAPYTIAPKVLMSIDGVKQVGYGQFQVYVSATTITSFTLTIFCAIDTLFSISWLSDSGSHIKSTNQISNIQAATFLNYNYLFTLNQQSQYVASVNGYLQPIFNILQGGDVQFINNSILATMQSNSSQLDFQLIEYSYLQNFEFNISTLGVDASYYGTQGVKHNLSLLNVPSQAQFIFLNTGIQIQQQIIQFMTFEERLNNVIQVELIFDGSNPQLNLTWNVLFGMVSCNNPLSTCDIEDYIISNCATSGGYYLDASNACQQCSSNCSTCTTDSVTCLTCQNNQILQQNQCLCPTDKYLEISTFICRDCDITCLTCSGPLSSNCLTCDIQRVFISDFQCICADGYYSDNKLCPQCLPNCVTCSDGVSCLTCPQNSEMKDNICLCNDGFYLDLKKRQCLQCSNRCLTCSALNTCIACNLVGYRVLKEGDCVCMDSYFENSSKQCISCNDKSAMLITSCNYKNCDDGIWTTAEGCDDGNKIDRDGCTKCEVDIGYKCVNVLLSPSFCYQCPTNCKSCTSINKIVTCQACNDGYFLSKNKCIKCGSNCKTCTQMNYCLTCYTIGKVPNDQGVCPTCEQAPGTYTVEGICVTKCGDGVMTSDEECDDNNLVDGDGCSSKCKLEEGFSCVNGQCAQKPQPIVQASYVNTTSTNIIQIQSDVQIPKFCSFITAKVDGFGDKDFSINVTSLDKSLCDIEFSFQKTILENNLIHIFYPLTQSSQRILSNDVRELVVTPRRQIYYSQSQLAQGQTVSSAQDTFSLFLYFIGPAAILLGGFNFFWTLLDILTWLNNLYYINVYFPANVSLIFQQSAWASISLIPTIIQFNQPSDSYYRESPSRYMDKGVDPFFFNNTYQIAGIWAAAISFYFISKLIIKCMGQSKHTRKQSADAYDQNSQFKSRQTIQSHNQAEKPLILRKIFVFAQDYQLNVVAYLIKTLNLTFLDLVTAIILQLLFYDLSQVQYILVFVNYVCALFSIIVVLGTLYLAYNVSVQHTKLLQHRKQKLRYGSLYEGINIKSANGMMYAFVNLIRKTLFITFQIYFYSKPLFQAALCCFISFLNVGFIVYAKPFENLEVLLQNFIPDFCIFGLMSLCSILAIDDKIAVLDPIQRFNIGWLMLGLISLSILTQIIFLMKQFVENAINNIRMASQYIKKLFK